MTQTGKQWNSKLRNEQICNELIIPTATLAAKSLILFFPFLSSLDSMKKRTNSIKAYFIVVDVELCCCDVESIFELNIKCVLTARGSPRGLFSHEKYRNVFLLLFPFIVCSNISKIQSFHRWLRWMEAQETRITLQRAMWVRQTDR